MVPSRSFARLRLRALSRSLHTTFPVLSESPSPYVNEKVPPLQHTHTDTYVQKAAASCTGVFGQRTQVMDRLGLLETDDIDGNDWIDMTCGIGCNTNPYVRLHATDIPEVLHTGNLVLNVESIRLATNLSKLTAYFGGLGKAPEPDSLSRDHADLPQVNMLDGVDYGFKTFLCNSGTEANEAAIKFARKHGKLAGGDAKHRILAFEHSFHGRTMGGLSITAKEAYRDPFAPLLPGVDFAPFNDMAALDLITDDTCGVIIEPIQGEGGVTSVDPAFLKALREKTRKHNALLIFDEVQCGFFRTGPHLWAHSEFPVDVHPDIVTNAKALGNGLPIGATVVTNAVANELAPGDHGTTFGGNNLVSEMSNLTLAAVVNKEMLATVQAQTELIDERLARATQLFPGLLAPHVRGRGLMRGLQFHNDADLPKAIARARDAHRLLVLASGQGIMRFLLPLLPRAEHHRFHVAFDKLEAVFYEMGM